MDKIAILTCVLGGFDTLTDPVEQDVPVVFHRWTDKNFPPNVGLTPRLQYRIPKTHGWQMLPGYDYYIWLDGSLSLLRQDCATWYFSQLDDADIAFFAHPNRSAIRDEVQYIDDKLNRRTGLRAGQDYIISRYENGGHKEQLQEALSDPTFVDNKLYHSGTFIYRNTPKVQDFMGDWLYTSARYFTCDQVALPWLLHKHKLKANTMSEPIYKSGYCSLVSKHK